MLGHSGAVHDLLALSENSVASCGADNLVKTMDNAVVRPPWLTPRLNQVILWKDGQVQSELRNHAASAWIVQRRFVSL